MSKANGHDTSKVTSIEEARKRAAAKARAEKRAARGQQASNVRDWIIGGIILAMALGYLASFFVGVPGLSGAVK